MYQEVALYIKMIAYYEQKLQTIKHTLISDNYANITKSYQLLSDNELLITKNALLNFFVLNVQPINYKDIIELIWVIGDKQQFTISFDEFQEYLTHIIIQHNTKQIEHSNHNLCTQIIQLLHQQLRVIKDVREKRQIILSLQEYNIQQIFNELSHFTNEITKQSLMYFMKKNNVQFTPYDYEFFAYAIFGQNHNINLDLFINSILFQPLKTQRHLLQNREIPNEQIPILDIPISQNITPSKSVGLEQSSILEFQVQTDPDIKQSSPAKSKNYISQTYVPKFH